MGSDTDRSHPGASAAVGNAEGLVQIDVADIGAHVRGPGQADLGVHVRAVHVDLSAAIVHDLADPPDLLLEHAMGGRIGDHEGGQPILVLVRLPLEIGKIHVALFIARDHDHPEARHDGGGGVGPMRRHGDEAHIALPRP